MPAYVESAALAVACRSNAGPALTAPERTRSPRGSLDRARLARERRLVEDRVALDHPVDGDHLAGLDEEPVTECDLVDVPRLQVAVLVAMHLLRRPSQQCRQLAMGAPIGVILEGLAAGQHQREHGAREVLLQRQAADDRQDRDHIDPGLAVHHGPDHADEDRQAAQDRRGRPHRVGRIVLIGRRERGARQQTRQAAEQPQAYEVRFLGGSRDPPQRGIEMPGHRRGRGGHVQLVGQRVAVDPVAAREAGDVRAGRRPPDVLRGRREFDRRRPPASRDRPRSARVGVPGRAPAIPPPRPGAGSPVRNAPARRRKAANSPVGRGGRAHPHARRPVLRGTRMARSSETRPGPLRARSPAGTPATPRLRAAQESCGDRTTQGSGARGSVSRA